MTRPQTVHPRRADTRALLFLGLLLQSTSAIFAQSATGATDQRADSLAREARFAAWRASNADVDVRVRRVVRDTRVANRIRYPTLLVDDSVGIRVARTLTP